MKLELTSYEKALLTPQELALFQPTPEYGYPGWDGEAKESTIKGKTDWRRLLKPLPCGAGLIYGNEDDKENSFEWNGASSGIFRKLIVLNFPKWKHPIATCRHDKRCDIAERFKKGNYDLYKKLRKYADEEFPKDVIVNGTKWEARKGYLAVRVGALI